MKLILCCSSIIVFLFTGLYLYQENFAPEWRTHQLAYIDQIGKKRLSSAAETTVSFSFDMGLKQIWLPRMNRADRCVSCHVAIEDPHFHSAANPLKAHPKGYLEKHDPEKHGCTICHDGQGRAVTFRDAAADDPEVFWDKPLLRKPFLEANCYRCHTDELDQTPAYNQGKQQLETSGCLGCHQRSGRGGFIGPEFVGIGDASSHVKYPKKSLAPETLAEWNHNQNLAYIYEAVRFPGAKPANTAMFDFKLSHEEAKTLTVYLKSLAVDQTGTTRLPPQPAHPLPTTAKGNRTFGLYCAACHGKNGVGGVKNPNYTNDFIPKLNTLSEQMFLYRKNKRDAVISLLDEYGDLLDAGPQPDIPGYFKVVAKYMAIKNIIINGRIVEKKNPQGATPINMPAWGKMIPQDEIQSIIAYLISIY